MANTILAQETRRADTLRHGENAARQAFSYGYFQTTGWGEVKAGTPILFDVVFTDKPAVMYAFEVVGGEQAIVTGRFPRADGGVFQWVKNDKEHYTAAYVMVTVDNISAWTAPSATSPGPDYIINHCFTFMGSAYKELPGLST